ncbi:MAG: pyruvate kinase [Nanoarchaeota archaeon]
MIKIPHKKTKIVATIGPASESEEIMTKLVLAGMNVARQNFSHGDYEEHNKRINIARKISEKLKVPLAILQDLSGPKIRIGDFKEGQVTLVPGKTLTLSVEPCEGTESKVFINYPTLNKELKKGSIVFLNDGKVKLEVERIEGKNIVCKILVGGAIKSKRGVNLPGAYLKISCLTDKDREDLKFGIKHEVDFMALSFVRKASDIIELKQILEKAKADIKVIAKIETPEAIENIDEIIKEADGVMVARGDLAVEVPAEEVPILQKMIIRKCNALGKPVITATQMMASMVNSAVPTRAEVNDVANAILDGTDAVMLSEETTLGDHPETVVKMMSKIAMHTEKYYPYEETLRRNHLSNKEITDSICNAAANLAHEIDAKAIVALTVSGHTAKMISRYRPKQPIIVVTPNKKVYNRSALKFNCYPVLTEMLQGVTDSIEKAKKISLETGFTKKGDKLIILAGIPFTHSGNTNLVLVQTV